MPIVRKRARDGVYALLAANFNAQYAEAQQFYPSAENVEIDWTPGVQGQAPAGSKNFFIGRVDEAQLEQSGLERYPALCLFTGSADDGPSDQREKFRKFSGDLDVGMLFFVKHRDGIEQDNVEDTISCFEDALLEVINGDSTIWPAGVNYNGDFKSGPPTVRFLGNGYVTVLPVELKFFVSV